MSSSVCLLPIPNFITTTRFYCHSRTLSRFFSDPVNPPTQTSIFPIGPSMMTDPTLRERPLGCKLPGRLG